jgi:hypothetical protein
MSLIRQKIKITRKYEIYELLFSRDIISTVDNLAYKINSIIIPTVEEPLSLKLRIDLNEKRKRYKRHNIQ